VERGGGMTWQEVLALFPAEAAAADHFVRARYGGQAVCGHCGSAKVYRRQGSGKVFDCNACGNTFSPLAGTIFAKSSTDLRKWLYALHIYSAGGPGLTGARLMAEVGVTYKTAWRMRAQIRSALAVPEQAAWLSALADFGGRSATPAAVSVAKEPAAKVDWSMPHVRVSYR
jgi:transposase-like protein